ncbi:MAG: alanine racemase [Deltaproteobacteria bacterium RIFCSPLOWO2_12_FULL_60_19]|nr:MAG: alanine racemase [Deltaproteobacteria bacterium RIFCSPLOWO2_12_FULL_60_19]
MKSPPKGRPTYCVIDLAALRWNFEQVKKRVGPGVKILSVVKANAYGHGVREVAKTLSRAGSDGFGVATVEEGIELRESGIRAPILVLTAIYAEQLGQLLQHKLTPAISDLDTLRGLERLLRKRSRSLQFHLKIDTGMGRLGLLHSEIESWLPELSKLKALKLEGLFSQLSHAEDEKAGYTRTQIEAFRRVLERLQKAGFNPPSIHLANSAALIAEGSSHFTMVRPGLMLYGLYPALEMARQVELKPVLSWKTRVMQVKRLPAGSSIGYGRTFVTQRDSSIATLPAGYADGYHRLLSNRGAALVRGKRAPIVGRISMDLTMVDVTDIAGVSQGDEVILLGRQGDAAISADELAGWAETISYEIVTSISARVPRIQKN